MAHNYTITSQQLLPPGTTGPTAANPDPNVLVLGTVDGVAVQVSTHFSTINQPTAIAYQNVMTPLLLAAWTALQPPSSQVPPSLSWTV